MTGWSVSLYFVMMFCTARARLSVPPPGPAVATNSIGFCGCQAACAGAEATYAMAAVDSRNADLFIVSLPSASCCLDRVIVTSCDLLGCLGDRCRREDGAFPLECLDLRIVKAVFAQHVARVLAIDRRAGAHLARR